MEAKLKEKILSLAALSERLAELRAQGHKVVQCHGVFDLLHPGHIEHFEQARKLGDVLVVSVTADRFVGKGPGRPAFPQDLRMQALAALECVDFVALSEEPSAVTCIRAVRPDFYVKGAEYADASQDRTGKIDHEAEAVHEGGGQVRFTEGQVFSSSSLVNRFFSPYPDETARYLDDFARRHSAAEVIEHLEGLQDLRVLIVGDAIIDQYSYVNALAKSPREMIVATRFMSEEQFAGGSVAVANHVACYVEEVTLVCAVNPEDGYLEYVREHLRPNVRLVPFATPDRPTVQKRRFLDHTFRTKMFEIQILDDSPYPPEAEERLLKLVGSLDGTFDMAMAADFGHGLLTERLRALLAGPDRFLAVNAQTNSANLGFNPVTAYPRADYACLHELELRLARQARHRDLDDLVRDSLEGLHARRLMVTRGPHGTVLYGADGGRVETPALAVRVVDRVGAGDSVFSLTAPCVYKGMPDDIVGFAGNCMGALAVEIVCNRQPVEPVPLFQFITHVLKR